MKTQEKAFIVPVFSRIKDVNEKLLSYLQRLRPDVIMSELKSVEDSNKELTEKMNALIQVMNQREQSAKEERERMAIKNNILLGLISLERNPVGAIKDKERHQDLLIKLDNAR